MPHVFGLIGYPLTHSFSKKYFTEKFEKEGLQNSHKYCIFEIQSIDLLDNIIKNTAYLQGLNVTIPYKQAVLPYLHSVSKEAAVIGAVNTIKISNSGALIGYNTDCYGFEKSLVPLLQKQHTQALILGTGGSSKAVAYVLQKLGIRYSFVSRSTPQSVDSNGNNFLNYAQINDSVLNTHFLIINTSPVGMYPNVNFYPNIDYNLLTNKHLCYDLVYNPAETLFLQKSAEQGAIAKNGLDMLYLQAERAWEIWNEG